MADRPGRRAGLPIRPPEQAGPWLSAAGSCGLDRVLLVAPGAPLTEGMLFSFEPNACHGRHRVNIGGTVAVGPSGPEELNSLPCRLHEAG